MYKPTGSSPVDGKPLGDESKLGGGSALPYYATATRVGHHKPPRFSHPAILYRPTVQGLRIPRVRTSTLVLIALTFYALCGYVTLRGSSTPEDHVHDTARAEETPNVSVFGPDSTSWAQYSPYYPVAPYMPPPEACEVDQVHIIQRHGARYPTRGAAGRIKAALAKLQSVSTATHPLLEFVQNYTYTLGEDSLVPFGARESFEAGREVYGRYASLVREKSLPFVRSSGSERVIQSATNWSAGFTAASKNIYRPVLSVIIPENGNDTLDDASCPLIVDSPIPDDWIAMYAANMTDFLNVAAPGANLSSADTHALVTLCAFDSVAREERSEWCNLFQGLDAFDDFEYWGDLDKYYGTGYGNLLGPVQGIGYVNELLARLTNTSVNDTTSTNSTLDSDPDTFPLGRTLYADFSHDNLMISVYAAMGLFQTEPLSTTERQDSVWVVNRMVTFSARMVVERIACSSDYEAGGEGEYVRVLVNQAVQPLTICGATRDGVCSLSAFVESQGFARSSGNGTWEKCF